MLQEQEVLDLIASTLEIPVSSLSRSTPSDQVPEWDSMGVMNLMMALKKQGIAVDFNNTTALTSVEGILELSRAAADSDKEAA